MTLELTRTELLRTQQIVDGEWQDAVTGRRFAVTNPATGQIIAQVADAAPASCLPSVPRSCAAGMPPSSSIARIWRG